MKTNKYSLTGFFILVYAVALSCIVSPVFAATTATGEIDAPVYVIRSSNHAMATGYLLEVPRLPRFKLSQCQ
jgi:hypothetical protein